MRVKSQTGYACQSASHSFQFSAFGNIQRTAFNLAQHQYDWQKLMLIAGKNSALIDTMPDCGGLTGTKAMHLREVLSQTCDARLWWLSGDLRRGRHETEIYAR